MPYPYKSNSLIEIEYDIALPISLYMKWFCIMLEQRLHLTPDNDTRSDNNIIDASYSIITNTM